MRLTGFQICKYRNIVDSGWIEVDGIAALVGQNECGKSNLLQALYKLRPFAPAEYDIDTDWPIDDWANRDPDTIVCRAQYDLSPAEIEALKAEAGRSSKALKEAPLFSDRPGAKAAAAPSQVWVARTYRNEMRVQFPPELGVELDPELASLWVGERMPRCVYMDDYATFAGHAELENLSDRLKRHGLEGLREDERTVLATLDLADLDLHDLAAKGKSEKGRAIRANDTAAASRMLNQRFRHKWEQREVRFTLRVDGGTLDILVEDEGLEAPVPLRQRSRGFQWFASFVWRFAKGSEGAFADCVLLLDEPGVHLHHAGHRDFLAFLNELAASNTILYTTHLSTMLDPQAPERIRIMEIRDHHSVVVNGLFSTQREPMMVIETLLGLGPGFVEMLASRECLIVSGIADAMILERLSRILLRSGEIALADRITLVPAAGPQVVPLLAAYLIGKGYTAGMLVNSDAAGRDARAKVAARFLPKADGAQPSRNGFRMLSYGEVVGARHEDFGIEDLFPVSFYLKAVNDAYDASVSEDDLAADGAPNLRRAEAALIKRGYAEAIDRARVLSALQRRLDGVRIKADLPVGTYTKVRVLFDRINAAFE